MGCKNILITIYNNLKKFQVDIVNLKFVDDTKRDLNDSKKTKCL